MTLSNASQTNNNLTSIAEALTSLQQSAAIDTTGTDSQDVDTNTHHPQVRAAVRNPALKFPEIVMQMISDEQNSSLIRWTRDGKAFVITNRKKLAETLLPLYFKKQTIKYRSFTRRLNRWGFVCCISSQDTCIYSHPLFQRDRPDLCTYMSACGENGSSTQKTYPHVTSMENITDEIPEMRTSPLLNHNVHAPSFDGHKEILAMATATRLQNVPIQIPIQVPVQMPVHIQYLNPGSNNFMSAMRRRMQAELSMQGQMNAIPFVSPAVTNTIVRDALSVLHRTNMVEKMVLQQRAASGNGYGLMNNNEIMLGMRSNPVVEEVSSSSEMEPRIRGACVA